MRPILAVGALSKDGKQSFDGCFFFHQPHNILKTRTNALCSSFKTAPDNSLVYCFHGLCVVTPLLLAASIRDSRVVVLDEVFSDVR